MKNRTVKEIETLAKEVGGTSFAGLVYTNKNGERSRYTINLGIDHTKVLRKDLIRLANVRENLYPVLAENFGADVAARAFAEVQKSIETSIEGTNVNSIAQKEAFVYFNTGMKFGLNTRKLYITGYKVAKKIFEKGIYPTVKSRPLTLAKKAIDKHLKRGNIRLFILDENQLETFRTNGKTIEIGV